MRRSKRLNVIQINDLDADGRHNTQQEIDAEAREDQQQDYDDHNISGEVWPFIGRTLCICFHKL